jgi:hypothetical protein
VSTRAEREEEAREEHRRGVAAGCIGCALGLSHTADECAAEDES